MGIYGRQFNISDKYMTSVDNKNGGTRLRAIDTSQDEDSIDIILPQKDSKIQSRKQSGITIFIYNYFNLSINFSISMCSILRPFCVFAIRTAKFAVCSEIRIVSS